MGEMGELCKSHFMYTRVRYCRGKMLKNISLHVLLLKNKSRGVCVCVIVCPMMVHAIASFNVPMILKSLLSKRFSFSPLFYWVVNNSFVSRLFVQSWVFHSKIYPP